MDTADDGGSVARQHGDARVRRGGVAYTSGHVATTWRSTSGQQISIHPRSACYAYIVRTMWKRKGKRGRETRKHARKGR